MNQVERKVAIMNLEQDKNTDKDTKDSPENPEVTNEESTAEEKSEAPEAKEEEKVEEPVSSEQEEEPVEVEEPSSEEVTESENEVTSEKVKETEAPDSDSEDNSQEYYSKILSKIKEVLETKDWGLISNEFSNLSLHIGEGPEPDEASKALLKEFDELRSDFEERKKAHYEELNRKREENLKKKKELLKQFADIVNEEKWTATKEVSQIKNSWDRITQIPRDEIDALNERFDSFMKEFDSH